MLLLGQEDINPDTPGIVFDQTLLSWAPMDRHGEIVKLLLGGKILTNSTSKYGRTPLSFATAGQRFRIVSCYTPNIPDVSGNWTPACFPGGCIPVLQELPPVSIGSGMFIWFFASSFSSIVFRD